MDAIKDHNFCITEFIEKLTAQGFDARHSGGTFISNDSDKNVKKIHQQYQIGTNKSSILTCSATSFYKTFLSVEESFDFLMFG